MIFWRILWLITCYSTGQRAKEQAEVAAFGTEELEDCGTEQKCRRTPVLVECSGSGTALCWLHPVFSSFHSRELWINGLNKLTSGIMCLRVAVWQSWAICLTLFGLGFFSAAPVWKFFLAILDTFIRGIPSTSINLGDLDQFSSGQRQHSKIWVAFDLLHRPFTFAIWGSISPLLGTRELKAMLIFFSWQNTLQII